MNQKIAKIDPSVAFIDKFTIVRCKTRFESYCICLIYCLINYITKNNHKISAISVRNNAPCLDKRLFVSSPTVPQLRLWINAVYARDPNKRLQTITVYDFVQ